MSHLFLDNVGEEHIEDTEFRTYILLQHLHREDVRLLLPFQNVAVSKCFCHIFEVLILKLTLRYLRAGVDIPPCLICVLALLRGHDELLETLLLFCCAIVHDPCPACPASSRHQRKVVALHVQHAPSCPSLFEIVRMSTAGAACISGPPQE